eukprot:10480780-Alexandrium_andersonii.AAC.1
MVHHPGPLGNCPTREEPPPLHARAIATAQLSACAAHRGVRSTCESTQRLCATACIPGATSADASPRA